LSFPFSLKLGFVFANVFSAGSAGVGRVLVGVAAEEAGGARPAAKQAADQADNPATAWRLLTHSCGDRSLAVRAGQADWVWTKWRRCGHGDGAEDNVEQYWWVSDETNLYNYKR